MATLASCSNLQKHFNSAKHSDITIETRNGTIMAHKLVLCEGCDYFRACFEGNFQESTAAKLRLLEDNPGAIDNLIRYLYGFFFCDYKESKLSEWAKNSDMLIHFSDLYVVAQKYLVPTLCEQAKITFCNLPEHATAFDSHAVTLASTVEHVYAKLADEATDLREPLVIHFADHVKDINESGTYRRVLSDFPEFAVDVTGLLVAQKSDMMTGKPGPAKKRKVVKMSAK